MGLQIDKGAPERLSRGLLRTTTAGIPVFAPEARGDLLLWVELRRNVYSHLMLAQPDFTTKLMLLYATVHAMRAGEFTDQDWNMTDVDFVARLLQSRVKETRDTADRWIAGEFWEMAPLFWLSGSAPEYSRLAEFSEILGKELKRTVFAYRIKDKRERKLRIEFDGGGNEVFGMSSNKWLLGVGSPTKRAINKKELAAIHEFAANFFRAQILSESVDVGANAVSQGFLL